MSTGGGWIGVDLDGTLAEYGVWEGPNVIGKPIPKMVSRVKSWLENGNSVAIFTARVSGTTKDSDVIKAIEDWCLEHIGQVLPITCQKDYGMIELWDDRCVQIIPNTGIRADGKE